MLIKLQTFVVTETENGLPSLADIDEAINICKNENCVVKIVPSPTAYLPNTYAGTGHYDITVTANSNAQDVYNAYYQIRLLKI